MQLLDCFVKKEKLRQIANRVYYEFQIIRSGDKGYSPLEDIGLYAFVICNRDNLPSSDKISAKTYMHIEFVGLFAEISDAITHQTPSPFQEHQRS